MQRTDGGFSLRQVLYYTFMRLKMGRRSAAQKNSSQCFTSQTNHLCVIVCCPWLFSSLCPSVLMVLVSRGFGRFFLSECEREEEPSGGFFLRLILIIIINYNKQKGDKTNLTKSINGSNKRTKSRVGEIKRLADNEKQVISMRIGTQSETRGREYQTLK